MSYLKSHLRISKTLNIGHDFCDKQVDNPGLKAMKTYPFSGKLWYAILTLSFMFFILSCQKVEFPDPGTLPQGLMGTWVEANTLSDTIHFNSNNTSGMFTLQRGFEIRNGYRLPVIGSTGYYYEIIGDSIYVIDGLSSTYYREAYFFHFDEPNLTINIGKFSKYIDTKKSILTFRKIW